VDQIFDARYLKRLRKILRSPVGLELSDDDLYACATSVIRFTAAKILRSRERLSQEENNGRTARK